MPGGFKDLSSKGKGREPGTPQQGEGSKHQQHFQPETEVGDSIEKEAEYDADEQGFDHQEDETTKTTPAPPCPPGDRFSEESMTKWDRPRSPPPTTTPRKATWRYFEREKSPEDQEWESLTRVISTRRTTNSSKGVKRRKLDPRATLDGDDNNYKNSPRFDEWVNAL